MANKKMKTKKTKENQEQDKPTRSRIVTVLLNLRNNMVFNCVMLALLGISVGIMSLLLGATVLGMPMFVTYFNNFVIILLNLLPPIILMFLLYFIFGRMWIAFTFPSFIILILSMVQFFKVQIHGDPFILSDILVAREVGAVMTEHTLTMNWKVYLAIALFVFGVLFSIFALKRKLSSKRIRIIAAVVAVAISVVLYITVYSNERVFEETKGDITKLEYSTAVEHISKGFLFQFIYSIHNLESSRVKYPDWYDSKEASQVLQSYPNADIPANQKVNIVSFMLESYVDLSRFDVLDFKVDVYEPLHRLQTESVSGTTISNAFAGWTIDPERLFLTGNTQLTTYRSPVNSYVYYLRSQGYYTEGLHSGERWFYDRRSVNNHLGFDRYLFLDDYEKGSRDDSFLFPAVLDLYNARDKSKPYFSYNLSFQGHIGFNSKWMLDQDAIAQGDMSDESFNILTNYLAGIYDTSWRLEGFIDSLRTDPEPVVVVVFGDHMPWLGDGGATYEEIGINIDRGTDDGFLNYYSTPYIIWANDSAKQKLGNDFVGEGRSFSTCFLLGEVFRLCSWEGDGYMQIMRELQEHVDIISPFNGMFRENGVLTTKLSPEAEAIYRKLRMMEIYRRENFSY